MVVRRINVGPFIRDYLLQAKKASISETHRAYRAAVNPLGYKSASYNTFAKYFYYLRKLGLIEKIGEAPPDHPTAKAMAIHKIIVQRRDAEEWKDPQKALYG